MLISSYKQGQIQSMTPELWQAKKVVDSTLHPGTLFRLGFEPSAISDSYPDTGKPVFLPFRMSCFVLSNLVVTAGMLTPGLQASLPPFLESNAADCYKTTGILLWQITNQSLNVAINSANANKSTSLSTSTMVKSYFLAVSASCTVALGLNALVPRLKRLSPVTKTTLARLVPFAAVASAGALNVFLMRGEEIRHGIDVFPVLTEDEKVQKEKSGVKVQSLGKSKKAATLAVGETALSRVLNSTPIMVLPPLILVRLQQLEWLKKRPRLTLPINLGKSDSILNMVSY